jgi:conjugative transposon TraK protein
VNQIKSLSKLENSNKTLRLVLIATLLCSAIVNVVCFFKANNTINEIRKSVYVTLRGESMEMMLSENSKNNKPAEIKNHIKLFHDLFFNLTADPKQIEENVVKRALYLGDKSVRSLHKLREEQKFYSYLISADAYQTVKIDSINLNMAVYPIEAEVFGKLTMVRSSVIEIKRLLATCKIEDVQNRSENNPHGLLITDYLADNSQIIETHARTK